MTMKKIVKSFALLSLLAFTLVSCFPEEIIEPDSDNKVEFGTDDEEEIKKKPK